MAAARGETGAVRDIPATRVKELMLGALEHLRRRARDLPNFFTRAALREWFAGQGVGEEAASALEHAFFRTVDPTPFGHGGFVLPPLAEKYIQHREWRFPAGRLGLDDVLFIIRAVRQSEREDEHVPATLVTFADRADKAVRSIGIDPGDD